MTNADIFLVCSQKVVADVCSVVWYKFSAKAAKVHYLLSINLILQQRPYDLAAGTGRVCACALREVPGHYCQLYDVYDCETNYYVTASVLSGLR